MTTTTKGIFAYTDGSMRSATGGAGSGAHGYVYRLPEGKEKPSKDGSWVATTEGYVLTSNLTSDHTQVVIEQIFNMVHPMPLGSTNNQAEISAILYFLINYQDHIRTASQIGIASDSQYTIDALTTYYKAWERNGWKTKDGNDVKNRELLMETRALLDACEKHAKVTFFKVRGHSGELGNVYADYLANVASNMSEQNDFTTSSSIGPTHFAHEKEQLHPFLNLKHVYFNTAEGYHEPGVYYQAGWKGMQAKDYIHGKPQPETIYSVVCLNEPDPVMESVINRQVQYGSEYNTLVYALLSRINHRDVYPWIYEYGGYGLVQDKRNLNLNGMDELPVTKEVRAHDLPLRAIEAFNHMEDLLTEFQETESERAADWTTYISKTFTATDITDAFYDTIEKKVKGKPVFLKELKKTLKPGVKELATVGYIQIGGELKAYPFTLYFNEDIPDRNYLKKLETANPRIVLIAWKTSENMACYATLVQCDDALGIWANYFSNRVVVQP